MVSPLEVVFMLAFAPEEKTMQEGVLSIEESFGDLRDPHSRTPDDDAIALPRIPASRSNSAKPVLEFN